MSPSLPEGQSGLCPDHHDPPSTQLVRAGYSLKSREGGASVLFDIARIYKKGGAGTSSLCMPRIGKACLLRSVCGMLVTVLSLHAPEHV